MFEEVFSQILRETQVMALRHKGENEAKELVEKIKKAIKDKKFEIVPREQNLNWLKKLNLNYKTANEKIYEQLTPKNFVAVLEDRNNPGEELYLFCLKIDGKWYTYMKVVFTEDKVVAISFHSQTERIYVDYRKSIDDEYDLSFLKYVAKDWIFRYNNRNPENKMTGYTLTPDSIFIDFEQIPGKEVIPDLVASCPKDKGLKVMELKVVPHRDTKQLEIFIPERDIR